MTDMLTTAGKIADLRNKIAQSRAPQGEEPTARTFAEGLVDPGSFVEIDALARHRSKDFGREHDRPYTDGVVTGYGLVGGQKVCVFAQDSTIFDGTLGEVYGEKVVKLYDLAIKTGVPVVAILAAGAPRAQEGIVTLGFQAKIYARATAASGLVPQIAVVVDEPASLLPELADLVVASPASAEATSRLTADVVAEDPIAAARELIGRLPANNRAEARRSDAPVIAGSIIDNISDTDRTLNDAPEDLHAIIAAVAEDVVELRAPGSGTAGMRCYLGRIEGRSVGLIAASSLADADRVTFAARFIRLCDAFNLQIIEFVDVAESASPAGSDAAAAKALAQLTHAYAAASVGKVTVNVRRAYGTAYVVCGSKDLGADLAYAWPTAEIAVADTAALAAELGVEADAAAEYMTPYQAAERGMVDAVIEPAATRGYLVEALRLLERKLSHAPAKKLSNILL